MTTRALYCPQNRELDLSELSASDYRLIRSLRGRLHRGDRVLLCLEPVEPGQDELFVQESGGNCYAVHFDGDRAHLVSRESDEHKWQKEYWYRAAEDAGHSAQVQYSTRRGTVLDVAIHAAVRTGVELRRAHTNARVAADRTAKAHRAGWLSLWFADADHAPSWFHRIPSVGYNRISWDALPPRRAATATGLKEVEPVKCTIRAFDRCPAGKRLHCGEFHPDLKPWRGVTVDQVAAMVPAGRAVALATSRGLVYVVPRESLDRYQELTGRTGLYVPGPDPHAAVPVPARQEGASPCLECKRCGQDLLLIRPGRELCERCHPTMRSDR
ncbi:hypothetical protein [Saccharothrix coeruleofusca]|uniref:Uncharacterized protein n=1 Tax=Saccharothrix coeruleofusca TaxID=33919 RepID=A0A918EIY8_9PSEU|nr:hypothetical protein [Saccharothrix coeruleofusca]GGP87458.1 hypothetical protein GCM10010185_71360 [Saccharothrix coeruleofusca]